MSVEDAPLVLSEGQSEEDFHYVQEYLLKYGYLAEGAFQLGTLDQATIGALAAFQRFSDHPPSGLFDEGTRQEMSKSRCGNSDADASLVAFSTRCAWGDRRITYVFDVGTTDTADTSEFEAVRAAMRTWEAAVRLRFVEVGSADSADVVIGWRPATDPDLDMTGGTLAHADFPPGCSVVVDDPPLPIHFDDDEHTWSIGATSGAFDVETVALHELGHILGLEHSSVAGAIMQPTIPMATERRVLTQDDIDGVLELYPDPPLWRVSWGGTSRWEEINTSRYRVRDMGFGDFNGDGKTDILTTVGGKWRVSWGGTSRWEEINTSRYRVRDMGFGDFNGDGKTDILTTVGGKWRVSWGGTSRWEEINTSRYRVRDMGFGDFNGDGKTDILTTVGGKWRVSWGGTSRWEEINTSRYRVRDMGFGDFNGDGKTDILTTVGGKWRVSWGGTSRWEEINTSRYRVRDMGFGDFNGDGKTDILTTVGGKWRVSWGGTSRWEEINTSRYRVRDMGFGDFNGDGKTDILRTG